MRLVTRLKDQSVLTNMADLGGLKVAGSSKGMDDTFEPGVS